MAWRCYEVLDRLVGCPNSNQKQFGLAASMLSPLSRFQLLLSRSSLLCFLATRFLASLCAAERWLQVAANMSRRQKLVRTAALIFSMLSLVSFPKGWYVAIDPFLEISARTREGLAVSHEQLFARNVEAAPSLSPSLHSSPEAAFLWDSAHMYPGTIVLLLYRASCFAYIWGSLQRLCSKETKCCARTCMGLWPAVAKSLFGPTLPHLKPVCCA